MGIGPNPSTRRSPWRNAAFDTQKDSLAKRAFTSASKPSTPTETDGAVGGGPEMTCP
jgi:hypothetical protein